MLFRSVASVPHSVCNAFKTLVSIAVECDSYSFEKADAYKALVPKDAPAAAAEEYSRRDERPTQRPSVLVAPSTVIVH